MFPLSELLAQIDLLTSTQDAAGLVALEDHEDKKGPQGGPYALHVLRLEASRFPGKRPSSAGQQEGSMRSAATSRKTAP